MKCWHQAMMRSRMVATILSCGLMLSMVLVPSVVLAEASPSTISAQASTPQVTARLLSSHLQVVAGQTVTLGIALTIAPEWHTYWRNPGDSGTVTTIDWRFSHPAKAGDILWPVPERHRMGPIVNYGYAKQVTLPVPIVVGDLVHVGEIWRAEAVVDWLVCKEECIPQQVKLALELPVVNASASYMAQPSPLITALQQQPKPAPWPVTLQAQQAGLQLQVLAPNISPQASIWFFPEAWGRIAQSVDQTVTRTPQGFSVALKSGDLPLKAGEALTGVLVIEDKAQRVGYAIAPTLQGSVPPTAPSQPTPQARSAALHWSVAVLFAFIGGLILNLMPCVLPVLSMKALALLSHPSLDRQARLHEGMAYTVGVVLSFVLLALLLVFLKASGQHIGWGFQFQSPIFVLLMAYLLFVVGLNLSGVFVFGSSVAGVGQALTTRSGLWGSFFTGVLATVVATPCTAPFMAAALGVALTQPLPILIAIFVSLGLGLAAPYLLIAAWPGAQRYLPTPGAWMDVLKQGLAFPMYGAAAWLVWVLAQQLDALVVAKALGGLLLLGFAAWVYGISRWASLAHRWVANSLVAISVCAALVIAGSVQGFSVTASPRPLSDLRSDRAPVTANSPPAWQAYRAQTLADLRAAGKPVFLNATAAWCISCLVNEKVALNQPAVKQAMVDRGITYLKADWTQQNPEITALLTQFGRSGVPLYVFYPAGSASQPVVLPQMLTTESVLSVFLTK